MSAMRASDARQPSRAFVVTEPGSAAARSLGCTCPDGGPEQLAGGGCRYARAADCPLHPYTSAYMAPTGDLPRRSVAR